MNASNEEIDALLNIIHAQDWNVITQSLHQDGFAMIKGVLSKIQCEALKALYHNPLVIRKTIQMERYRFGKGQYKYLKYPLPRLIQVLRMTIYPYLTPIANSWFQMLGINNFYPDTHHEFLDICKRYKQDKPTILLLKYQQGDFNTLHQDLYGQVYFPLQMVLVLNQSQQDFSGGEFILTQQIPRAQSKAIAIQPDKGDILLFTTQFKPEQGKRGYYRAYMRHGVSPLHSGERYSLGIMFHDAMS